MLPARPLRPKPMVNELQIIDLVINRVLVKLAKDFSGTRLKPSISHMNFYSKFESLMQQLFPKPGPRIHQIATLPTPMHQR